jgi:hypothetical protein
MVGVAAFITGVVGFFLPGQFLYSPVIMTFLTQYGNFLFPGIAYNPAVNVLISKAPVFALIFVGLFLMIKGYIKGRT